MAGALLGPVLDDFQPDRGKLEDLTALALFGAERPIRFVHGDTALWTAILFAVAMLDDIIRIGDAFQGFAAPSLLSAGFATGLAPQALGLGPD